MTMTGGNQARVPMQGPAGGDNDLRENGAPPELVT